MGPLRPTRMFRFQTSRIRFEAATQEIHVEPSCRRPRMEPTSLWIPIPRERLSRTQDEVHRVPILVPGEEPFQSATGETLEHGRLVIEWIEWFHSDRWICPQAALAACFLEIGDAAIGLEEQPTQIDIEVVPCVIVEHLGDAVVILLHANDA